MRGSRRGRWWPAGDRAALSAFVRATQRDVLRFVAHLADPGQAEDLAQETYLRALRALPAFEAASTARTWLLSIARAREPAHLLGRRHRHGSSSRSSTRG